MTLPASQPPVSSSDLLPPLPLLRARLTLRLLADGPLPPYKGGMLRGGFGYAFRRTSCPQACWNLAGTCAIDTLCPYRWVFETPHPPEIEHLHALRDVPRPFVLEPPDDHRTSYRAGEALEFGLVLIGRGIDYLPYFLFSFQELGRMGIGRQGTPARLERVEALHPWQAVGQAIYQDGRVLDGVEVLPLLDGPAIVAHAARLPSDLRLALRTPLRVKTQGD